MALSSFETRKKNLYFLTQKVREFKYQFNFKLDTYQGDSWSQQHTFSVYLWKVMKSLDERNQAQHV